MSEHILMHSDTRVCLLDMRSPCHVGQVLSVYDASHIPVGCCNSLGVLDCAALTEWLTRRIIPVGRLNFKQVCVRLGDAEPDKIAGLNYMASLSDSYWLLPAGSNLKYVFADFHQCAFGEACSDVLLTLPKKKFRRKLYTPSFALNGKFPKAWIMRHGTPVLLKAGGQAVNNELIASRMLDVMGISHVKYEYLDYHGVRCACCDCVVGKYEDFVPAYDIAQNESTYHSGWDAVEAYLAFAMSEGLDVRSQMDGQIVLDFLMRNVDRYWHNFGLIRDAMTLKYVRAMPVFDTGTSLFHMEPVDTRVCGFSALTEMRLYDDLAHVSEFTGGMRESVGIFPDVVKETLREIEMPDGRLDRLVDFAASNCNAVLNFFG